MDDIDKVSKHLKTEDGQGYVLYYTDHKGQDREVIQDRFYEIEKQK